MLHVPVCAEGVCVNEKTGYVGQTFNIIVVYNVMCIIKVKSVFKGVIINGKANYGKEYQDYALFINQIFHDRFFTLFNILNILAAGKLFGSMVNIFLNCDSAYSYFP